MFSNPKLMHQRKKETYQLDQLKKLNNTSTLMEQENVYLRVQIIIHQKIIGSYATQSESDNWESFDFECDEEDIFETNKELFHGRVAKDCNTFERK